MVLRLPTTTHIPPPPPPPPHTHTQPRAHTLTRAHTHTHTCTHTHIHPTHHTHTHARTHACASTHTGKHTCTRKHTCKRARPSLYIHTHTPHTYTNTPFLGPEKPPNNWHMRFEQTSLSQVRTQPPLPSPTGGTGVSGDMPASNSRLSRSCISRRNSKTEAYTTRLAYHVHDILLPTRNTTTYTTTNI
jgi:hypothetical protein